MHICFAHACRWRVGANVRGPLFRYAFRILTTGARQVHQAEQSCGTMLLLHLWCVGPGALNP